MREPHGDVIQATREFVEASAELRGALVHAEEGLLKGIDVLERGGTPMQNLRTSQTKLQRTSVQSAMEQFTEARHRFRMLMISECVHDGMKARELSEMWGFSRQRAAKLIGESRELAPAGAAVEGVELQEGPGRDGTGRGAGHHLDHPDRPTAAPVGSVGAKVATWRPQIPESVLTEGEHG